MDARNAILISTAGNDALGSMLEATRCYRR